MNKVDWKVVNLVRWNDTEDDPDRKRRKQAEFLIFNELVVTAIQGIVVYDKTTKNSVLNILSSYSYAPKVIVRPKWYY